MAKFKFIERIGAGGFGDVWKAQDLELRRLVAIKLFEPGGSAISSALDHAQALARVNHPNVVQIYEVVSLCHPETEELCNAIVMELLTGSTLERRLEAELAREEADRLCEGILAGLEALHQAGIAHADLHGGNVMLHGGSPKLLDVLYRGTLAVQSNTQKESLLRRDIRQAVGEIDHILQCASCSDAAAKFRRLAREAGSIAAVRDALQSSHEQNDANFIESLKSPPTHMNLSRQTLIEWHDDCLARFQEVLAEPEIPVGDLYAKGYYSVAYTLASYRIAPADLLAAMRRVGELTGWPPWYVHSQPGIAPYSMRGKIECWLRDFQQFALAHRTPNHADFWIVSPDVRFFALRGYDEDSNSELAPGMALSQNMPIWRIGECIWHAIQMGRLIGCEEQQINFSIRFKGLSGRDLISWSQEWGKHRISGPSREDSFAVDFSFKPPQGEVSPESLLDVLRAPLDLLFEQFEFAKVSEKLYRSELVKLFKVR